MSKKKVIITRHAEERAIQRGVSIEEIKETIDKPTQKTPIKGKVQEFRRTTNKGINIVIAEIKGNDLIIITTWWENGKSTKN